MCKGVIGSKDVHRSKSSWLTVDYEITMNDIIATNPIGIMAHLKFHRNHKQSRNQSSESNWGNQEGTPKKQIKAPDLAPSRVQQRKQMGTLEDQRKRPIGRLHWSCKLSIWAPCMDQKDVPMDTSNALFTDHSNTGFNMKVSLMESPPK